jgi:heavy metal translocating P-type ATPase
MHRELRSIDRPFLRESHGLLYAFTLLIAFLVSLDLWPVLAAWLNPTFALNLPAGSSTVSVFGTSIRWAMIAAVFGALRTLTTSLESLVAGRLGADLALALAVLAAILLDQPLVAAEVISIGLVGECLEAYTFGRTQDAIRKLVETIPPMCLVFREGRQVMVPLDDVLVGERVAVLPGKRVPVDGVIIEGTSSLDMSNLTGESVPVEKKQGDPVLAGTVNQYGMLTVEVQRVTTQTVMGQVIAATATALQDKAHGQRTADQLASYFLPIVLALAAVTWLGHWWWLRGTGATLFQISAPALAVLVVACPCALILATPAATMAALARLARTGILVKRGSALERLAQIKTMVFDKTGTLTTAQLSVGRVMPLVAGLSEDDLLRQAASVEQGSEHPLGQAVVNAARQKGIALSAATATQASPGLGIVSKIDGATIRIGSAGLTWTNEPWRELEAQGQTVLLVARDSQLLGAIGVWDTMRVDAPAVVQELRQLGLHIALLSGDRPDIVASIARCAGIEQHYGECLPADKATKLATLPGPVAMVGDGVNDAPALAKASVGLAVSSMQVNQGAPRLGSDIAAECSDIVLMGEPLRNLPLLIRLSREMVTIIRQNILWFAIGVNIVGITLIAWLLPAWSPEGRSQSPLWAAVYHQIGSVLVLLNSMRLLWYERTPGRLASVWNERSQRVDAWFDRISLHEASHWVMDHMRPLTWVGVGLMVLLYLSTAVHTIPAESVGVVRRCGRLQETVLQPGLHVQLPWPWDEVSLVEPGQVRRVEVGFRRTTGRSDAQTWASEHRDNTLLDPNEALVMTADGNLVEVQAVLLYRLSDPRLYLTGSLSHETLLRGQVEATLREVTATRKFDDILAADRASFQQALHIRLRERLQILDRHLGIEVLSLALEDIHPPQPVVKDYYDVTRALATRSRLITEARIDAEKAVSRETVVMRRQRAEAEGDSAARITQAAAERDAFLALVLGQRVLSSVPSPMMMSLFDRLTQYRLTLEAAEQLLAQRPKVLRDSRLKGTMQVVPDALRWRLPSLQESSPPKPELP